MTRAHGETVQAVLQALHDIGPMTRNELCKEIGITRGCMGEILTRLSRPGKRPVRPRLIYVLDYRYDEEGQRTYPRAIYALGDLPDKPAPSPKSGKMKQRAYSARRRAQRVNSVFAIGRTALKAILR